MVFSLAVLGLTSLPGAVIYTYDFPGTPGSGLAVDQTNPQPPNATFSDFTRQGSIVASGGGADVFDTKNWSLSTSIDRTQFEGFSITGAANAVLNLTQLSFHIDNAAYGPADFQVELYLNGSSIAYASADYHTQGVITTLTFNFTPLTTADNTTTATFEFFGWNAASAGAHLVLDDVATSGTIAIVPEPEQGVFVIFAFMGAVIYLHGRRKTATRIKRAP